MDLQLLVEEVEEQLELELVLELVQNSHKANFQKTSQKQDHWKVSHSFLKLLADHSKEVLVEFKVPPTSDIPPGELNNPAGAALADITGVEGPNETGDEVG